jgi:branched-chain amino acid transport system substrate-binding protein
MNKRRMGMMFWLVCFCFLSSLIWTAGPVLAQKEKKEILIGASLPISGPLAMASVEQVWSYEQAVADVNKGGGIYIKEYGKKLPVRLTIVDDEADPGKAAAAVERLIKRTKVDFLLGGHTAAHGTLPGLITAEKYHKLYHTSFIWTALFLEHKFKWGTMFFFDPGEAAVSVYKIWSSVPEDQRPQKPALLLEDSFDGKIVNDLMSEKAVKAGYNIALKEAITMGAKDFTTQILKCKEAGVDAIFILADTAETVTILRQMKENKLSVKFFIGWKGTWPTEFFQAMGKDSDYILNDGFWSKDFPFPGSKELGERYYKKYNKDSVSVGMMYALCQILFQAIEKAGTLDTAKVRQAILDNEFNTTMGKVKYDEKGIALFPLPYFQWWQGKQELVYPFDLTKYKVKPAPPWDKR